MIHACLVKSPKVYPLHKQLPRWHGMACCRYLFFFLKIMAGALPSIKVGNRGFSVQIAIPGLGRENDRNTTKLTEELLSQSIYGPLS